MRSGRGFNVVGFGILGLCGFRVLCFSSKIGELECVCVCVCVCGRGRWGGGDAVARGACEGVLAGAAPGLGPAAAAKWERGTSPKRQKSKARIEETYFLPARID